MNHTFRRVRNFSSDQIAKVAFLVCLSVGFWMYGVFAHKYLLFPYPQAKFLISQSRLAVRELSGYVEPESNWFFYRKPNGPTPYVKTYLPQVVAPGFVLYYGIGDNHRMAVHIIDSEGNAIHTWETDIFKLWPNPDHIPEDRRPISQPGFEISGLVFLPDGDIVFNADPIGLIRVDYCGRVVWRLPYSTHHSVHLDESGNFFVSGQLFHSEQNPDWPLIKPGTEEPTILEVSPEGKIVEAFSVFDLLKENHLQSLLYVTAPSNWGVEVSGDFLHLNDVEPFPSSLEKGEFEHGDVMVSLRNIHTLFVFNKFSRKIKYLYTGDVIRQHDPDFISGNKISIFDNHSLVPVQKLKTKRPDNVSSKIVILDARDNSTSVYFEGSKKIPFFTDIIAR